MILITGATGTSGVPIVKALLDRAMKMRAKEQQQLHGTFRHPFAKGDRVRLAPKHRADARPIVRCPQV